MDVDLRTLLRIFLVVGGLGYIGWGALDGRMLNVAIGVLATAVGLFGLWYEGVGPGPDRQS